jgi:hypothetical protein
MNRYRKDDGTFGMGMIAAGMALIGFCAGYAIRDNGYVLNINQSPTPKEVKAR